MRCAGAGVALLMPLLLLLHQVRSEGGARRLAPWFEAEPPPLVEYLATAGTTVRCAAAGHPPPALSWHHAGAGAGAGAPLHLDPHLRRVHSNGTLEMVPARSGGGEEGGEGGELVVACRASNAHGVAVSREVTLRAVAETRWETAASAVPARAGAVAALACRAAPANPRVRPALWYRGDTLIHLAHPTPESRYVSAGELLLIREVSPADAGPYSCVARHALSALSRRSPPALLALAEGSGGGSAPRLAAAPAAVSVQAGADVCLPCVASDYPPPQYTWYREWNGRLQPVEEGGAGGAWLWAGGAALCVRGAALAHQGVWLCKAYNAFGDATAQHRLTVRDTLAVTVAPTLVRAAAGSTVRFNCSASAPGAALSWLHDGTPAPSGGAGAELVVRQAARHHTGVYQCVARRAHDSAQAAAELQLGESAPELVYTFIEQALRPGGGVSLRCAAAGAPPPRLAWLLDGAPLDAYTAPHRYSVSEETTPGGDTVSALNITAVSVADGGRYTCRARNDLGATEHSARLNIYGPPSIRALGPVRVVAGDNVTVHCPYAGYPISSISWWRRGASVAVGAAGRVSARGAALRLAPALPPDAGPYACVVAASHGPAARRDIEIQVRNPPKISPFIFSSDLTEGSSVQVLCGVSSGDKPMYFSWLKDGAPLPANLQIEEKSLNEFSLLMFSELRAAHSGAYTCRVHNHAATVNYTATLTVNVAPAWALEPLDVSVVVGAPLLVECAATGHPAPAAVWYRRIASGEGAGAAPESEQWEPVGGGGGAWSAPGGVRASNGSLCAAAAARHHQGLYRCVADNGVGPPLLKHVNVTVHEPAHFAESGGNVSCVRGQSAALSCLALGDAPLAVHWTHRGQRLDLHSYRWSVSEARSGGGLRSTLSLRAAERGDAGEYRCQARNAHGAASLALQLAVLEPPAAPRALRLAGLGARWARLAWRPSPAGPLRYTALCTPLQPLPGVEPAQPPLNLTLDEEDGSPVGGEGEAWARVSRLRPAAAYSVRLAAANHVGQSPYSEPLVFTTLEEAPAVSPMNVRARPMGSGELHVTWSVPQRDAWNGELLGYVASWRELGAPAGGAGGAGRATAPGGGSTELTLGGLRTAARYALSVRAYNTAGAGPPSPLLYATTADGVPEVPPTSVTCEGVAARSLRVRWSPPPTHTHSLRGYDVHYSPLDLTPSWGSAGAGSGGARAGPSGEATLQGLAPNTNYSVWVVARADAGLGPPSAPAYCATPEDVPGAVRAVRALPAGADAVRVTWLAPARRAASLTHYTLYTRELGKVGSEWSQRVEAAPDEEEVWREVRGLRPAAYEAWVRAVAARGPGPPSSPVTAAPAHAVSARISSLSRVVVVGRGSRVVLPCAAVGAPPVRRRWTPLPHAHTLTDTGDLVIHKVAMSHGGNYTCSVRNVGGADAAVFTLAVVGPPGAPAAPRLVRADMHALHLAWNSPHDGGATLLGYTVTWSREEAGEEAGAEGGAGSARVPAHEAALTMARLACGARYRVTLQAHNAVGASPSSLPLSARTRGDKAVAAPGKEFVWANSSALRLNLLTWRARCPVAAWSVALRPAGGGEWRDLPADGESAAAGGLRAAAWYEVRVVARSAAGDTAALYRAPTRKLTGESIGEAAEETAERRGGAADAAGGGADGAEGAWRSGLGAALLGGGAAALLAALGGALAVRRGAACLRCECAPRTAAPSCEPHSQLYSTEPSKRNGKAISAGEGPLEISPYATFSMSEGAGGGGAGCALHLRTFGRAEPELAAAPPPPRPNLLHHEYGRGRSSDSESSGSPCAACAAHLYRDSTPHNHDTLPRESSAEDTSYSTSGGGWRGARHSADATRQKREPSELGARQAANGRRRREHLAPASTVRYSGGGAARAPDLRLQPLALRPC